MSALVGYVVRLRGPPLLASISCNTIASELNAISASKYELVGEDASGSGECCRAPDIMGSVSEPGECCGACEATSSSSLSSSLSEPPFES